MFQTKQPHYTSGTHFKHVYSPRSADNMLTRSLTLSRGVICKPTLYTYIHLWRHSSVFLIVPHNTNVTLETILLSRMNVVIEFFGFFRIRDTTIISRSFYRLVLCFEFIGTFTIDALDECTMRSAIEVFGCNCYSIENNIGTNYKKRNKSTLIKYCFFSHTL